MPCVLFDIEDGHFANGVGTCQSPIDTSMFGWLWDESWSGMHACPDGHSALTDVFFPIIDGIIMFCILHQSATALSFCFYSHVALID